MLRHARRCRLHAWLASGSFAEAFLGGAFLGEVLYPCLGVSVTLRKFGIYAVFLISAFRMIISRLRADRLDLTGAFEMKTVEDVWNLCGYSSLGLTGPE